MNELQKLRNQIDEIDSRIIKLFEKRMGVVLGVAEYKKTHNTGVLQTSREDEVLQKAVDNLDNKEYAEQAKNLMVEIMSLSKDLQKSKMTRVSCLRDYVRKPLDLSATKGFYGDRGSNTEQAMIDFFGDSNGNSYATFEEVFKALKRGEIEYGVLPIENSSTGAITEVYDLMRKYDYFIVGEQWVSIKHCLLGIKGAKEEDIQEVYSHHQAITQSDEFLSKRNWRIIPYKSTSSSAKYVADAQDKTKGAIASEKNAELYGLEVIKSNIQSQSCNYTRFVVVSKYLLESEDSDKTSIVFALNSQPGALCNALKVFAKNGINLLNIESRPVENAPETYYFYTDLEYPCNSQKLLTALNDISEMSTFFDVVGEYKKGRING